MYMLHVAYVPRAREGPECTSKLVCRCLYDMVSGSYPCCGGVGVCYMFIIYNHPKVENMDYSRRNPQLSEDLKCS